MEEQSFVTDDMQKDMESLIHEMKNRFQERNTQIQDTKKLIKSCTLIIIIINIISFLKYFVLLMLAAQIFS